MGMVIIALPGVEGSLDTCERHRPRREGHDGPLQKHLAAAGHPQVAVVPFRTTALARTLTAGQAWRTARMV
jgi:hypothetical protein